MLPVGVPVLAQASLAALSSCELLLQGISLVPHAAPGSEQPCVCFYFTLHCPSLAASSHCVLPLSK